MFSSEGLVFNVLFKLFSMFIGCSPGKHNYSATLPCITWSQKPLWPHTWPISSKTKVTLFPREWECCLCSNLQMVPFISSGNTIFSSLLLWHCIKEQLFHIHLSLQYVKSLRFKIVGLCLYLQDKPGKSPNVSFSNTIYEGSQGDLQTAFLETYFTAFKVMNHWQVHIWIKYPQALNSHL